MSDRLPKLNWFPVYVEKILSSASWLQMKDYQRGWYIQLLLLAAHSERPGYLPLDGPLWRLAGAHSEQYFQRESAAVLACFKRRQMDGREWIYNERLLSVLEEQARKQQAAEKRSGKSSGKDEDPQPTLPLSFSSSQFESGEHAEELRTTVKDLFQHYCRLFGKEGRYKLTESRAEACAARLRECLSDNGGNLSAAKTMALQAMENLGRSEFHTTHGYCDWNDHIFKSLEIFQKRLDMKVAPTIVQPGSGNGAFADPNFGKNDHLKEWLGDIDWENRAMLKKVKRERDPLPPAIRTGSA